MLGLESLFCITAVHGVVTAVVECNEGFLSALKSVSACLKDPSIDAQTVAL